MGFLKSVRFWKDKPLLRSTDGYIAAVTTARFLEGKKRILIVGDAAGRDWRYLQELGKEIYTLDIAPQPGSFPNFYLQSIEDRTPFSNGFFDGLVMNEVLEHLFRDVDALQEVHRILTADGVLVITIPYFANVQDRDEYHVRVHSPRTVVRLLERCGFEVEEHFCRGFGTWIPQSALGIRGMLYASFKLVEFATRGSPDGAVRIVNGRIERLERFLGSHRATVPFQRRFSTYGGLMKVKKGPRRDFDEVQRKHFTRMELR